jgi:uncharacterized protein
MKDTLLFIVSQIVDNPADVAVDEATDEKRTIFTLHVNPDDMGKVIGKKGRIIKAIRDLVKLMAAKHNIFVDVVLAE